MLRDIATPLSAVSEQAAIKERAAMLSSLVDIAAATRQHTPAMLVYASGII